MFYFFLFFVLSFLSVISDIGDIEGFVISVYDWDAVGKDDFLGEGKSDMRRARKICFLFEKF